MKRTLAHFAEVAAGRLVGTDDGFSQVSIDSRKLGAGDLFLALPGERVDGHEFISAAQAAGAAGAVVTHAVAVALPQIIVRDVAAALTAAGRHWRSQFTAPVVGVAGSNGKTTVKEMTAAILTRRGECLATAGNLNNHLGVPLTLLRLTASQRSAVIEIGANHPGEVAALASLARPTIGLITNAGAEHLEGFGNLDGVARAEGEMVASLGTDDVAVINADDPYAPLWRGMTRARVVSFGLAEGADVRASQLGFDVDARGFVTRFRLQTASGQVPVELALAGRHNIVNALAAAAAAMAAGATLADVAAGLGAMRAVKGRLQFRRALSGAWVIDDSYNANPSSVLAAIDVLAQLPGPRWLVLGDMGELGESAETSHREMGRAARERGIERLFAHGPLAALAAAEFGRGAEAHLQAESLIASLAGSLTPEVRLLIKGSRLNRLERVVMALCEAPAARKAG